MVYVTEATPVTEFRWERSCLDCTASAVNSESSCMSPRQRERVPRKTHGQHMGRMRREQSMDCRSMQELIQVYLDSELDARSTLEVQQHLEACNRCARTLESLAEQDRHLKESARAESVSSADVREKILAAIHHQSIATTRGRRTFGDWRKVAAAAAIITLGAFLWLLGGLLPGRNQNVYAAIATDHVVCSVDRHLGAGITIQELNRLAASYGKLASLPDLSSFGYTDPRGRICRVKGLEFLHLVFYNSEHQPLSLFLRPHAVGLIPEQLSVVDTDRGNVATLSRNGVDLLVVTPQGETRAASVAEAVAKRFEVR